MSDGYIEAPDLEPFLNDGWITDVIGVVKSGKEATVYSCKGGPRAGSDLIAAKVYLPPDWRNFRNDAVYQEGRVILDARIRRAVKKKTRMGREAQPVLWVGHEYETLKRLYQAGADVPKAIASMGQATLMEFVGDREMAAPPLRNAVLDPDEARSLFGVVMRNVELWLSLNCVHGDLSAFNILYWHGSVKAIDFPQAVDPRFNRNALELLTRDIRNVCTYFERYGVQSDPDRIARGLWNRSRHGEL